jgi:hypothetical protein
LGFFRLCKVGLVEGYKEGRDQRGCTISRTHCFTPHIILEPMSHVTDRDCNPYTPVPSRSLHGLAILSTSYLFCDCYHDPLRLKALRRSFPQWSSPPPLHKPGKCSFITTKGAKQFLVFEAPFDSSLRGLSYDHQTACASPSVLFGSSQYTKGYMHGHNIPPLCQTYVYIVKETPSF